MQKCPHQFSNVKVKVLWHDWLICEIRRATHECKKKNYYLEFKSKRFSTVWSLSAPDHLQTSLWLVLLKASIIFLWMKRQWCQRAHNEGLLAGSKGSFGARGLIMKAFSQAPRAPVVTEGSSWRPSNRLYEMQNLGMLSKKW